MTNQGRHFAPQTVVTGFFWGASLENPNPKPPPPQYKITAYVGTGTSCVVEAVPANERGGHGGFFKTLEEAQAAADRANAGDMTGLYAATYADD